MASIKSDIAGVNDLPGKRTLTVDKTTVTSFLSARRIPFVVVPTIDDAYRQLEAGEADAVVFDAPVLQHRVQVAGSSRLAIVGGAFQREDYGIGMPTGSALRKPVNDALLAMRADGTYDAIYERYFGSTTR